MRTRALPPFNGRVSDKFYIREFPNWREVEGEPLVIPGFEELDLFIHRYDDFFRVSEGITGCYLVATEFTGADARHRAAQYLLDANKTFLENVVSNTLVRSGISPRYGGSPDSFQEEECYAVKVSNTDLDHENSSWYGKTDFSGEWTLEPKCRLQAEREAEHLNQLFYPPHRYTARRYPQ